MKLLNKEEQKKEKKRLLTYREKIKELENQRNELLEALEKISVCIKNTPAIGDLDLLKLRTREIDYLVNKIKESGKNE